VRGATGSGKTTVARRLGELLGLPVIELDALFWQPNWTQTPRDEFRARVGAALDACRDGWVCDGNYGSSIGDLLPARADTVVWLHLPWRVSFWRVFTRTVSHAWSRELLWGNNRESWRLTFLDRDSLLLWSISHHRANERGLRMAVAPLLGRLRLHELRSGREVAAFLRTLEPTQAAGVSGGEGQQQPAR